MLLLRKMLEHGTAEGPSFLSQLEFARVTSWRCPCGCASFNLIVETDAPSVQARSYVVADFLFGSEDQLSGIFVFQKDGRLAGIDVYGLAVDAPKTLPRFEDLRRLPDDLP